MNQQNSNLLAPCSTSPAVNSVDILTKLDQLKACVHCGICLSACPTYLTTSNEGHSPRGRLYLIRDFTEARFRSIEPYNNSCDTTLSTVPHCDKHSSSANATQADYNAASEQVINYLDACLGCRACETACPSGVEYVEILDYARNEARLSNYTKGFWAQIRKLSFKYLLANRFLLNLARIKLRIANNTGIIFILKNLIPTLKLSPRLDFKYKKIKTNYIYRARTNTSKHLVQLQDLTKSNLRQGSPQLQVSSTKTTISLPLGCVMDTLYNQVHWDTIKVLNAFGFDVYIPETKCCGALAAHSGEHELGIKQANSLLESLVEAGSRLTESQPQCETNMSLPQNDAMSAIVMNSAGCGAFLKEVSANRAPKSPTTQTTIATVQIYDFIEILKQAPLSFEEFAQKLQNTKALKATYHPACHLNHAQGIKDEYIELLKLIPNLTLIPLQEADVCCGSAGIYNLIKPDLADPIGKRKSQNIKKTKADIVLTANPGCMSQIQAYAPDLQVMHPISLIANYLRD